ncbi:MAG: TlpA disulfide reductase family protein [Betaproteobacteria bacterium]
MGVILCSHLSLANAQWLPASKLGLTKTPVTNLVDLQGKIFRLEQYRGQVLFVNFWATWCEPCRDEFKEVIELQKKYQHQNFVVIAINLAESPNKINEFFQINQIDPKSLIVVSDRNGITYKTWKGRGIPISFLINKKGIVDSYWLGEITASRSEILPHIDDLLHSP